MFIHNFGRSWPDSFRLNECSSLDLSAWEGAGTLQIALRLDSKLSSFARRRITPQAADVGRWCRARMRDKPNDH